MNVLSSVLVPMICHAIKHVVNIIYQTDKQVLDCIQFDKLLAPSPANQCTEQRPSVLQAIYIFTKHPYRMVIVLFVQ